MSEPETELKPCPILPTEEMWGGLARSIMMWLDFGPPHTPRGLLEHLRCTGIEPPPWLLNESEMDAPDHSMSKGTRCAIIYRAMIEAAPTRPTPEIGEDELVERLRVAADETDELVQMVARMAEEKGVDLSNVLSRPATVGQLRYEHAATIRQAADRLILYREALVTAEAEARRFAGFYPEGSDGRNTFVIFADKIAALSGERR